MKRTRVLGIAPYEGMRNLMVQLAEKMEDVCLTSFVGDLEHGASIAAQYSAEDFDVILSRGGTAELIRQKTDLPVVDIELSVYDILRSIRLAESSGNRFAIVGFPAITRNVSFLCDALRCQIDYYTIHDEAEARAALARLSTQGCNMVLCDMITNSLAQEYGIPAILIISGSESVEAALRQAESISRVFRPMQDRVALLHALLCGYAEPLTVLDESGAVVYNTVEERLPVEVDRRMRTLVSGVLAEGGKRSNLTLGARQYQLSGRALLHDGARYAVFRVRESSVHPHLEKSGIRFLDKEEAFDLFFNSFYGVTQPSMLKLYERYAESDAPVMIVGEKGTGKNQMARLLYGKSRYQNAPLCMVDCMQLRQKGWNYLMVNESTPLASSGITLCFLNADALEEAAFCQLFTALRDTQFAKRNRLMFRCTLEADGTLPPCYQRLLSWFGCMVLELSPLRAHKQEIPQLSSLYISLLNMRNATEIIGIEQEGLQLLEAYDWPENYDQFKRVLRDLVVTGDTPYIQASAIREALRRERAMYPESQAAPLAEALRGKTLEEISLLAIRQALVEEKGNQTAAANRLGISRTTLWRMLQKYEAEGANKTR